jgi:hypothetical protein
MPMIEIRMIGVIVLVLLIWRLGFIRHLEFGIWN